MITEPIGYDCCNQPIVPVSSTLRLHTNRHRSTSGRQWGWISGCTRNIVWADDKKFDYKAAKELVDTYNTTKTQRKTK